MALDLGASDLMVEIAPDGEDGIDEGLSYNMKEFEVQIDRHSGK